MAKNNLCIVARERGKIVALRETHNIWVNTGRTFLSALMSYTDGTTPERDDRVLYMGFGVGGDKQEAASAETSPITDYYPGTNVQSCLDPYVTTLERPVLCSTGVWLKQIEAVDHPTIFSTRYTCSITTSEINDALYPKVPLAEIGLFTSAADPAEPDNDLIAYATFEAVEKTDLFSFEVYWSVRF